MSYQIPDGIAIVGPRTVQFVGGPYDGGIRVVNAMPYCVAMLPDYVRADGGSFSPDEIIPVRFGQYDPGDPIQHDSEGRELWRWTGDDQ